MSVRIFIMEEKHETLGQIIDSIDSLAHGLQLAIPDRMHVEALKAILPEKVKALKESFIEITGENPWT